MSATMSMAIARNENSNIARYAKPDSQIIGITPPPCRMSRKMHITLCNRATIGIMIALGLATALSPNVEARQDSIKIKNFLLNENDTLNVGHLEDSLEGYDANDISYGGIPPFYTQYPKVVTEVEGYQLKQDARPTNSTSKFEAKLIGVIKDGNDISSSNKLSIRTDTNSLFNGFNPSRHYTGEYVVYSNYNQAGTEFRERKNIRDLCTNYNAYFDWNGPNVFIPASETNEHGDVHFGEFNLGCEWNEINSSSEGEGTNSFIGKEILDYNTNRTVTLQANPWNFVDYYVLTRTDNVGERTITTNTISPRTNLVDIVLNELKGSNSLHAVYSPYTTTAGTPHSWYASHGITNNFEHHDTNDTDGDGFTGRQEYLADTHPTNGTSFFPPISLQASGSTLLFGINPTSTQRRYHVEATTNLAPVDWQPVTNAPGTGGAWNPEIAMPEEDTLFYRGRVTLP